MDKITGVLVAATVLCFINTVQCQGQVQSPSQGPNQDQVQIKGQAKAIPMSTVEKELRQNLTKVVHFVVDPSANITEDLVNFALASGGEPQTRSERMDYITIMEKIARETPDFMKNFRTVQTLADGTKIESVDDVALRAQLVRRGLEYEQMIRNKNINTNPIATTPQPDFSLFNMFGGNMYANNNFQGIFW